MCLSVLVCMFMFVCECGSGNSVLQSPQYGLLYPVFVYNSAFSLCITPAGRDSQVMEREGEGDGYRERVVGGRERKRDCEWYQWNLFVCTLLSRLEPLVRWCHGLMFLWSEVTGLWRWRMVMFRTGYHQPPYVTFTQLDGIVQCSCIIIESWLKLCQKRKNTFSISVGSVSVSLHAVFFHRFPIWHVIEVALGNASRWPDSSWSHSWIELS